MKPLECWDAEEDTVFSPLWQVAQCLETPSVALQDGASTVLSLDAATDTPPQTNQGRTDILYVFANIGLLDKIWNWPVTVVLLQFIWWCFVRDYRKSVKCLRGEMILLLGFTHDHHCVQMFQKQRETVYWSLASTAATVVLTHLMEAIKVLLLCDSVKSDHTDMIQIFLDSAWLTLSKNISPPQWINIQESA